MLKFRLLLCHKEKESVLGVRKKAEWVVRDRKEGCRKWGILAERLELKGSGQIWEVDFRCMLLCVGCLQTQSLTFVFINSWEAFWSDSGRPSAYGTEPSRTLPLASTDTL